MVEDNTSSSVSDWPVHGLMKLEKVVEAARDANKYLFIWDKQGNVGRFMQYKGQLAMIGPSVLKVSIG